MKIHTFASQEETAIGMIEKIIDLAANHKESKFHIAFSGGSTPKLMFDLWVKEYKDKTPWDKLCVYLVDERCVPPEDSESNYGMMKIHLLDHVPIPPDQIYRIRGEDDPEEEAKRYSRLVYEKLPKSKDGYPQFDLIILGAGDDGHTSSIFPGQEDLLKSSDIYLPSINPYTQQKRIALTGEPMINASQVYFLITGTNKAKVVADIFESNENGPAAYIAHFSVSTEIFIDEDASTELDRTHE
ncbi:MAG: 6-phosphogluconolactonase [Bacteroidales bacterium]|nr:6-phosphogluconolactonase [Bacteroidales bacterium]